MKRNKNWIWVFTVLGILGAIVVVLPIVYNLSLQLTPEMLAEARAKWQQHGPDSYDLEYSIRVDDQQHPDVYKVKVRDRAITEAICNDKPLSPTDPAAQTVPDLFNIIESGLQQDQKPDQRRNYAIAYFEKRMGFPIRYIRRIRGSRSRLEINTKLTINGKPAK